MKIEQTHGNSPLAVPSTSSTTTYHRIVIDGVGIFYREAGPKDAPAIVLLHGYPTHRHRRGFPRAVSAPGC